MMKINAQAGIIFVKQRNEARKSPRSIVHSYVMSEPHETSGDLNEEGKLCWCDPTIEDFSDQGGGILVIHNMQTWQ